MPAFSYWTVGPIDEYSTSKWCFGSGKELGISYFHTWINCGITMISQIFHGGFIFKHGFTGVFIFKPGKLILGHLAFFGIYCLPFHVFSMIMLVLVQYLDHWKCCNKSITKRSLLNIDNPLETIFLEEKAKKGRVANYCCMITLIITLTIFYTVFLVNLLGDFS